jgi:hypothetical protein
MVFLEKVGEEWPATGRCIFKLFLNQTLFWLSNISTLNVPDEVYFRKRVIHTNFDLKFRFSKYNVNYVTYIIYPLIDIIPITDVLQTERILKQQSKYIYERSKVVIKSGCRRQIDNTMTKRTSNGPQNTTQKAKYGENPIPFIYIINN